MKQSTTKYNQHFKFLLGVFLSLFLGIYSESLQAQTYPVQTNVYLMPPYGKHLNDYYTTSKEKLVVSLLNRDQQKPVLEVRLRMSITASNGLKLQSKEEVNYPTITLDANIPTRLTQEDLAPYFQYINTQGYLDQGKLPDGMVEFTFQVIEKYTGKVLSAPATGRAWLSTQKPPILRLPSCNESIGYRDPMNLKFQWEPQHKNLSQVEYEFELRELPDNGAAPQSAFMYSPIIHQQRQLYTYLIYDAMMPLLEPNKLYGWRVRAIAKDGVDELNMFENNGYSEIYWFRTQDNCQAPIALAVDLQNRRLDLKWLPEIGNNEFIVQYRPKYGTSEDWQEIRTYDLNTSIYDMQRGTVYEYRVGAICTSGEPVFTNTGEINIPSVDSTRLANCGVPPTLDLSNKELLPELRVGDRVELSDYPMTVTKVSGANGHFTGEGWVPVNWLLETKWAVEFSNITVNTDYKMIAGSVRAKYDETEGNIANIDQITEGGSDNTRNGIIHADIELEFSIPENPSFTYNPDSGEITVFDTNGNPQTVTAPKENDGKVVFPFVVKDKDGNLYKVDVPRDEDGNPLTDENGELKKEDEKNVSLETSYLGKQEQAFDESSFDKKSISTNVAIITFEKGEGVYAFDTWLDIYNDISKIGKKYDHLAAQGQNKNKYDVPWKLLPSGTTDMVQAHLSINDKFNEDTKHKAFDPKEVIFATEQGVRFNAEFDGKNTYTINLTSGVEKDIQEIYALYPINGSSEKFYTLGKLNAITYAKQTRKLVIVSIDKNEISDKQALENKLKEVYTPVGVTWEVSYDDGFQYDGDTKNFFEKNSPLLSAYNDNMNELQTAYKQYKGSLDSEAAYLFILDDSGDGKNRDTQGFMPRGKQFGYIFLKNIKDSKGDVNQIIAHELGHACWSLSHTFDSTYGEKISKDDKLNLMSYGGGTHIAKWQWDVMDSPAWFTNPLDNDEKGKKEIDLYEIWNGVNTAPIPFDVTSSTHFILPTGQIIHFTDEQIEKIQRIYLDENSFLISLGDMTNTYDHSQSSNNAENNTFLNGRFINFEQLEKDLANGKESASKVTKRQKNIGDKSYTFYSNIPTSYYLLQLSENNFDECSNELDVLVRGKQNAYQIVKMVDEYCKALDPQSCDYNLFYKPITLGWVDANTVGEYNKEVLKGMIIQNGTKYSFGKDLAKTIVDDPKYINQGASNKGDKLFKEHTLEELNKKMAYLEMSSGYQFYTMFFSQSCTFSQEMANESAKSFLTADYVPKDGQEKRILCLILDNNENRTGDLAKITIGLAFGDEVPADIRNIVREGMGTIVPTKDFNYTDRLITTYKAIPKKRLIYQFCIDRVLSKQDRVNWETEAKKFKDDNTLSDGSVYPPFIGTIQVKKLEVEKSTGLALDVEYINSETNEQYAIDYSFKEEYIGYNNSFIEDKNGPVVAVICQLAKKYANWDFTYYRKISQTIPGSTNSERQVVTKEENSEPDGGSAFFDYYVSGTKSESTQKIDAAILVVNIVSPFKYQAVVTIVTSIYYLSQGEEDTALLYLVGYGIGKATPLLINKGFIVANKVSNYYRLQKTARLLAKEMDLQHAKGLTTTEQKLIVEFYEKPLTNSRFEYILKSGENTNYFVKIDESSVLVATLKESSSGALEVQYISSNFNYKNSFSKAEDITESFLRETIEEISKASIDKDKLIWSYIKATQETYPGSFLPKSFELNTLKGKVWVHPNATEHIAEFIQMKANNYTPEVVRLSTQVQLKSLHSAVEKVMKDGLKYETTLQVNEWELIFSKPREVGLLPVLKHARPLY